MGYDAVSEVDMTVCVESYIGELDGHEEVKLAEMARITVFGCGLVGRFPLEEEFLASRGSSVIEVPSPHMPKGEASQGFGIH